MIELINLLQRKGLTDVEAYRFAEYLGKVKFSIEELEAYKERVARDLAPNVQDMLLGFILYFFKPPINHYNLEEVPVEETLPEEVGSPWLYEQRV